MGKNPNVCQVCGKRDVCEFANSVRIVCNFAMMHFNFSLPLTCFKCLDMKLCLERHNYNPKEFRCTGMKLQNGERIEQKI